MLRLKVRDVVVPDDNEGRHYRYLHRETGHWSHSADYASWIEEARLHRKANDLPIPPDFEAQLENQLCESLGPEWCDRANESWVSTRFTLEDFKNGMKAFGRLFLGGFKFVSQAEADRRAKICGSCPYNVNLPGCSTCRKLSEFVTGDVAQRSTAHDATLKACAVCHCANRAQVHFPMDALDTTDTPEKQALYPSGFCWKSKASPNYRDNLPMTPQLEPAFA